MFFFYCYGYEITFFTVRVEHHYHKQIIQWQHVCQYVELMSLFVEHVHFLKL